MRAPGAREKVRHSLDGMLERLKKLEVNTKQAAAVQASVSTALLSEAHKVAIVLPKLPSQLDG